MNTKDAPKLKKFNLKLTATLLSTVFSISLLDEKLHQTVSADTATQITTTDTNTEPINTTEPTQPFEPAVPDYSTPLITNTLENYQLNDSKDEVTDNW